MIPNQRDCARAMAKVIAYLRIQRQRDAEYWFKELARLLGMEHLLK